MRRRSARGGGLQSSIQRTQQTGRLTQFKEGAKLNAKEGMWSADVGLSDMTIKLMKMECELTSTT